MNLRAATYLAFLVITVLTALAVLAAALGWVPGAAPELVSWGIPAVLAEIVLTVVLYARSGTISAATAVKALQGTWWQFIYGDVSSAISVVAVTVGPDGRLLLNGEGFDPQGRFVAQWHADNAAFNAGTRELFYFWEGVEHDQGRGELSGIGMYLFEPDASGGIRDRAQGRFTRGDLLSAAEESGPQDVQRIELRRASADEAAALRSSDEEERSKVVREVYGAWARRRGRDPGVRRESPDGGASE